MVLGNVIHVTIRVIVHIMEAVKSLDNLAAPSELYGSREKVWIIWLHRQNRKPTGNSLDNLASPSGIVW